MTKCRVVRRPNNRSDELFYFYAQKKWLNIFWMDLPYITETYEYTRCYVLGMSCYPFSSIRPNTFRFTE